MPGLWLAASCSFFVVTGSPAAVDAQGIPELYGEGATVDFDEDGDLSLRFISWHQIWLRASQLAPGSTVDGSQDEWQTDVMLRRARFYVAAQLTDRALIISHIGINNQTFTNGGVGGDGFRPQIYFHDVAVEFRVHEDHLFLGGGLLYWNGISRLTSAGTLNLMTLDAPILNWPLVDITDQLARQLGVYAKGELGPIHYRTQLTRPFIRDSAAFERPEEAGAETVFNAEANTWAISTYVNYDFWQKETHKLPFFTGSYLGTKKVLNVGTGLHWHPSAVVRCKQTAGATCDPADQDIQDIFLYGLDVFMDLPVDDGAVTAYAVYYYYDMGRDYVRTVGTGDLTAGPSGSGPGISYPSIGTGNHFYGQLGYMLPIKPWNLHRITPYVTFQSSFLEGLDDPANIVELGVKYHVLGHHATVTLNWRNRPVFGTGETDPGTGETTFVASRSQESRGNDLILQLMLYL